jgi:hypothetical protein
MITGPLIMAGGLAYSFTSVPQMPATSTRSSAESASVSGRSNSRSSVVPAATRTAA